MEQFLKDFFNDNSVCVGLCDLKRKTLDLKPQMYAPVQPQQTTQQVYQQVYQQNYTQAKQTFAQPKPQVQQKPQRQTLAQKFAEQQRAYAQQQAYLAQQRERFAQVQQTLEQSTQPRPVQQKAVYSEAKPVYANQNSYIQQAPQQHSQTRVIVNGNMKKVVSPAIPARYV